MKIRNFIAAFAVMAASTALGKPVVLLLATGADKMTNGTPTGLWLEEFAVPFNAFQKQGFELIIATPKGGRIPVDPRSKPTAEQAAAWKDASAKLEGAVALDSVDLSKVDAIFIPGGHGAMFDLATDTRVAKTISELDARGKFVAAVCHGPAGLVQAKRADGKPVVAGKTVAVFTDDEERAVKLDQEMPFLLESRFRELGAKVEKKAIFTSNAVRDGNLITGQNPASSEAAADLLIKALAPGAG